MNNNKGISLIEVIVAVGIMSLLSFFIMDMINSQNKAIKTTQYLMDVNEAQNQIQKYMVESNVCKNSLAGHEFPPDVEVPIDSIKRDASTVLLSPSPPYNKIGALEIESLMVKRKPIPDDKELELIIKFKKTNSTTSYGGDRFLPRKVRLSVQFKPSPSNEIENCFSYLEGVIATTLRLSCAQFCPKCIFDEPTLKCAPKAGSASLILYRNIRTGAITSTPTPTSIRYAVCIDGGNNGVNAENAAKLKCSDLGGVVAGAGNDRGGCSSGGRSYTGWADCNYTYEYLGTVNP